MKYIEAIFRFLTPIIYLFLWYFIPFMIFGPTKLNIPALTYAALPVLFIGIIAKQSSWSIFGEHGIRGDNIGRKVKGHMERRGAFEFQGYELDNEKIEGILKSITNNKPLRKGELED